MNNPQVSTIAMKSIIPKIAGIPKFINIINQKFWGWFIIVDPFVDFFSGPLQRRSEMMVVEPRS